MGSTFISGASRNDIIRDQTKDWENKEAGVKDRHIKHVLRGNCLWQVRERTNKDGSIEKWIMLSLLLRDKEYGWGYKDMDESCGPNYHTVPLAWLDEVPMPNSKYAPEWRERVRAHYAFQNAGVKVVVGDRYTLKGTHGFNGCVAEITSVRPLKARIEGYPYRIKRKFLDQKVA